MEILAYMILGLVVGRVLVAIDEDRRCREFAKLIGPVRPASTEMPTLAEVGRAEWMSR